MLRDLGRHRTVLAVPEIAMRLAPGYAIAMPDAAYATFIEDCRTERAHLFGLIEALEGNTISPGARIAVPGPLVAATRATLVAFQQTVIQLNTLIDAYDAASKA